MTDSSIQESKSDSTESSIKYEKDPKPVVRTYRGEKSKKFDLVHTKLEVSFDWGKRYLFGKATIQLKPHFYPQRYLELDAKGFDIHNVLFIKGDLREELTYEYNEKILAIDLNREIKRGETLTVLIDYTAKPYELKDIGGGSAITENRGLYFINHDGKEENVPRQIWTQGETESSSCWFPTIDAPNQKSTQEIYITVDNSFKTLSNGKLIYSQINEDSTRTDCWQLNQPHAPYLFMMAIGEYAIVEDQWNDIPVNYYVEPEYEPYAKDIFGNTPEMMTFFSDLIDYPYPWPKYSQVVVRDYVSGAMENTTASVYLEDIQMTSRELLDGDYEDVIAHELFHHWFGDLVTCESWANLTLNEGFASYSEYLWTAYKKDKSYAEYKLHEELETYLSEAEQKKEDLIRFYYDDKDDMFDSHSYSKGGLILHMLRDYVGDDAFFSSLNHYLKKHEYGTAEVHDLRIAFEEVVGEDLNWFFDQWFLTKGHPEFNVTHTYVDSLAEIRLNVWQQQDTSEIPIYRIPINVEIFSKDNVLDTILWIDQWHNHFKIKSNYQPDLVLFNSREDIVAEVSHKKGVEEWIAQTERASNAVARLKAFEHLFEDSTVLVDNVFHNGLDDPFSEIVRTSIAYASEKGDTLIRAWRDKLIALAKNSPDTEIRSDALYSIFEVFGDEYSNLYYDALKDSSYLVAGTALYSLLQLSVEDSDNLVESFLAVENVNIVLPLASYFVYSQDTTKFNWFVRQIKNGESEARYFLIRMIGQYMMSLNEEKVERGINVLSDVALTDPRYFMRIAALQSLQLFEDNFLAKKKLQEINENEKDERVRRFLN